MQPPLAHPLRRSPAVSFFGRRRGILQHWCAAPGPHPTLLRAPCRAPIHLMPSRPWRAPRPPKDTTAGRGGLRLCLGVRWGTLNVPLTRACWLPQFPTR
jgi:hypothetical protein